MGSDKSQATEGNLHGFPIFPIGLNPTSLSEVAGWCGEAWKSTGKGCWGWPETTDGLQVAVHQVSS